MSLSFFKEKTLPSVLFIALSLSVICIIFPVNKGSILAIYIWFFLCAILFYFEQDNSKFTIFALFCLSLMLTAPILIFFDKLYIWYFVSFPFVITCIIHRTLFYNKLFLLITIYYAVFLLIYLMISL